MLQGKDIVIRPLQQDDYGHLYRIRTDLESLHLWQSRDIPSEKEYYQELDNISQGRSDLFLVIVKRDVNIPVGMAFTHGCDFTDGFAFSAIVLAGPFRGQGIGMQASVLLLDFVFANYPLRKIYADVLAYNLPSLAMLKTIGFTEEGCFRAHRYYGGKYWDNYRFAFYREDVERLMRLRLAVSNHADEHRSPRVDNS